MSWVKKILQSKVAKSFADSKIGKQILETKLAQKATAEVEKNPDVIVTKAFVWSKSYGLGGMILAPVFFGFMWNQNRVAMNQIVATVDEYKMLLIDFYENMPSVLDSPIVKKAVEESALVAPNKKLKSTGFIIMGVEEVDDDKAMGIEEVDDDKA